MKIFKYNELSHVVNHLESLLNYGIKSTITGGYFQVLHKGHIELLKKSGHNSGPLIVAIGSDEACQRKSGYCFLPFEHRAAIIAELPYVTSVVENPFDNMVQLLKELPVGYYCKGGDVTETTLHDGEKNVCVEKGITIMYNMGGGKVASSSDYLKKYIDAYVGGLLK